MIGYITLGTNDLARAGAFYDKLLAPLGAERTLQDERMLGWSNHRNGVLLSVIEPYNGAPATVGNGVMVALNADTPAQVEAIYQLALSLGAQDEGHPHDRGSSMGFYGGYFRDLDGNKLVAYCLGLPEPPSEDELSEG
ncbi:MAG: VOC family protein [Pseudomonadota bacterium]